MIKISRRHLMATSALAAVASLAACAGATSSSVLTQLSTDVGLVQAGFTTLTAAGSFPNMPATTQAEITNDLTTIANDVKVVQQAVASGNVPVAANVTEIANLAEVIIPLITPFVPAGGAALVTIDAIESLLPVIVAAVGENTVTAKTPVYTPEIARAILAGKGR